MLFNDSNIASSFHAQLQITPILILLLKLQVDKSEKKFLIFLCIF